MQFDMLIKNIAKYLQGILNMNNDKPNRYPCPACGFLVFEKPPGSFDACPVCGWGDDHVQLANPLLGCGANEQCLAEAQVKALKKYPAGVREYGGFMRDPTWRPLKPEEMKANRKTPDSAYEYFKPAAADDLEYYWRK